MSIFSSVMMCGWRKLGTGAVRVRFEWSTSLPIFSFLSLALVLRLSARVPSVALLESLLELPLLLSLRVLLPLSLLLSLRFESSTSGIAASATVLTTVPSLLRTDASGVVTITVCAATAEKVPALAPVPRVAPSAALSAASAATFLLDRRRGARARRRCGLDAPPAPPGPATPSSQSGRPHAGG